MTGFPMRLGRPWHHHRTMAINLRPRRHQRNLLETVGPSTSGARRRHLARAMSLAAFIYLTATIVVMASERVYWYWAGFNPDSVLFLAAFYLIPTMAGLWALALAPARRVHHVVLAGAIFAFVVEGVLTPIIYIDGPLPVMASMFNGWHGVIAFVGFWYLIRRWLLARQFARIALGSIVFGALWGVWGLASALADPPDLEEAAELGFDPTLLVPGEFALYAVQVGATLALSHWLIGFVWPTGWKPGKVSTRALVVVSALYLSVAVLPAVFWAPLKLAVLIGGTWRLLRRPPGPAEAVSTAGAGPSAEPEPTILDRLAGPVRLRDVALLLMMPATAALAYAAVWQFRTNVAALEAAYWSFVTVQIIIGAAAFIWAWRQTRPQPGGGHGYEATGVAISTRMPFGSRT